MSCVMHLRVLKPEEAAILAMLRSRLAKEVAAKSGPMGETAHAT
jgi:hypothetical protein